MCAAKVLVVEDEPILALELAEDLGKASYSVPATINNGDMILSGVLKHKPDLIIMDIKLFGFRNGLEEALRLRAFFKTPIIYLSSYPYEEVKVQVERTQPAWYLEKPYDELRMLALIDEVLSMDSIRA